MEVTSGTGSIQIKYKEINTPSRSYKYCKIELITGAI